MLADRIEHRWIDAFERTFALCGVAKDEPCAILSETQSRSVNVHLAELALQRMGAKPFHVTAITPGPDGAGARALDRRDTGAPGP